MGEFTHFNEKGEPRMVDVSHKDVTSRLAKAQSRVIMNKETYLMVKEGRMKKGDVLSVAQVAGIMAAKECSSLIPMCHPINISGVDMDFISDDENYSITIEASVKCKGETGVEMEALTAASVAALTIYDMCKAVQRDIVISDTYLLEKSGGKSGVFTREE